MSKVESEIAERAAREIHEATFQNLKAQGLNIKHLECESKISKIKAIVERAIEESRGQPPKWKCPAMDAVCANCGLTYGRHFKDFCAADRKGTKFALRALPDPPKGNENV